MGYGNCTCKFPSLVDAVVCRLCGELPKQHQELLNCTFRKKCLIWRPPFIKPPLWFRKSKVSPRFSDLFILFSREMSPVSFLRRGLVSLPRTTTSRDSLTFTTVMSANTCVFGELQLSKSLTSQQTCVIGVLQLSKLIKNSSKFLSLLTLPRSIQTSRTAFVGAPIPRLPRRVR